MRDDLYELAFIVKQLCLSASGRSTSNEERRMYGEMAQDAGRLTFSLAERYEELEKRIINLEHWSLTKPNEENKT